MREGTKKMFVFHADEIRSERGSTSTTSATIPSLNGKNRLNPMRYLVTLWVNFCLFAMSSQLLRHQGNVMPVRVRNIPDGNWDGNCRQIQIKVKQKLWAVTHTFLHLPKNYYLCSQTLSQWWFSSAVCLVHSSHLALISSVHIDKVLVELRFRKIYVLKAIASFSKNFLQITDVNSLPTIS